MAKAESVRKRRLSQTTYAPAGEVARRFGAAQDDEILKRAIRRIATRMDVTGPLKASAEIIADTESSAADALNHIEKSAEAVRRSLERLNKRSD